MFFMHDFSFLLQGEAAALKDLQWDTEKWSMARLEMILARTESTYFCLEEMKVVSDKQCQILCTQIIWNLLSGLGPLL